MLTLAEEMGIGDRVEVDLSIARGLDYYTGTIYETFLTNVDNFGAIMSGGRYDELLDVLWTRPDSICGDQLRDRPTLLGSRRNRED